MYIWKQWKLPKTRVENLKKLGMPEWQAYRNGNTRKGCWAIAGSGILTHTITNSLFIYYAPQMTDKIARNNLPYFGKYEVCNIKMIQKRKIIFIKRQKNKNVILYIEKYKNV